METASGSTFTIHHQLITPTSEISRRFANQTVHIVIHITPRDSDFDIDFENCPETLGSKAVLKTSPKGVQGVR